MSGDIFSPCSQRKIVSKVSHPPYRISTLIFRCLASDPHAPRTQSESEDERQRRRLAEMFPDFSGEFEDILLQDPAYRAAKERAKEEADEAARANGTAPQTTQVRWSDHAISNSGSQCEYHSFLTACTQPKMWV